MLIATKEVELLCCMKDLLNMLLVGIRSQRESNRLVNLDGRTGYNKSLCREERECVMSALHCRSPPWHGKRFLQP